MLSAVPSLDEAPHGLLTRLVDLGRIVRIPADWAMLIENTAADKAYVLLKGEVHVQRGVTPLARCGPGEIVGEFGIVRRQLRSATVVSATDLLVLHLTRAAFEELHSTRPYFRDLVEEAMLRKCA